MPERVNYPFLPAIAGPYVHAVKHQQTMYISGLTALGTDAQCSGLPEQTQAILDQISAVLDYERRTISDLIKLTIYVKDISQLGSIRMLLKHFYSGCLPACSLVEVSRLVDPALQIEIEATVALE